jgi:hypothetical protein
MCPMCLAATGLYVAGGLSTGAVSTVLVTRILRKRNLPNRPEVAEPTPRAEANMHTPMIASSNGRRNGIGRSHER